MKRILLGAASTLFLAAAAFAAPAAQPGHQNPAPGSANETVSAVKDTTYGLVAQISSEMTTTTKGFINAAATSDLYEVTAAKMVEAHTATTEKLKGLIAAHDIAVIPPNHVDGLHQGLLDSLRAAKADD